MSKKQIKQYAFYPGPSGVGNVKLVGRYQAEDFLLVTNITAGGIPLLNFSDSTKPYSVSFTVTSELSPDTDFPYAHHMADGITKITFLHDTSQYSSEDDLQIFAESQENTVRPWDFGTDAIERTRVAEAQSMLDADFEYGIQPTKWQSIDLFRGYPSLYEIPGSDIAISTIVTDGSVASAGVGPSLITVTSVLSHGLSIGSPISVRGVDDSVNGYAKVEGSFVVSSVDSDTQFKFYSKGKVGNLSNTNLKTNFTVLKKSGFYTGSSIGSNPTFAVSSQGGSGSFSTSSISGQSQSLLGLGANSSSLPPIGSTISGLGVTSGSQVVSITSSTTTINVKDSFTAPTPQITITDPSGVEIGHALDDGNGVNIYVTDVTGDTVTFSSPYTLDKVGNNIDTSPKEETSTINYNNGSGFFVDVTASLGQYTVALANTITNQISSSQIVYSGSGSGASFVVKRDATTRVYTVEQKDAGEFYAATETITILGADLGGTSPANNLLVTINTVGPGGEIETFTSSGTGSTVNTNVGINYGVNESLKIFGNELGGSSPENDLTINILSIDSNGKVLTFNSTGTAPSSSKNYSGLPGSQTTSTSGINATFDIERIGSGSSEKQLEEITISGPIELGDFFRVSIEGDVGGPYPTMVTSDYTTATDDNIYDVRNGLISAINQNYINGTIDAYARVGDGDGKILVESQTANEPFTISVVTTDLSGAAKDDQDIIVVQVTAPSLTSTTPSYVVTAGNLGSGYVGSDQIVISGQELGGVDSTNDLTITVSTVDSNGGVVTFTSSGTASSGTISSSENLPQQLANGLLITTSVNSLGNYISAVSNNGISYKVGYQFVIAGAILGGITPDNNLTATVVNISSTGEVTSISVSGTPKSGDTLQLRPSVGLSENITSDVSPATSYSFAELAEVLVTFDSDHGLLPGSNILSMISSSGSNHDLLAGPTLVTEVPSHTTLKYIARSAGTIGASITGNVYSRTDCFYTHRPFDGGVQLGTGSPAHGAQAIRQSKKYIRYQSGKGIMYTSGALFAPSYDLRDVISDGLAVGSTITITTDDVDHSLQVGAEVQLTGIKTPGYNGHYTVTKIISENTFAVSAVENLESTTVEFDSQPQVSLYKWKGSIVRAGAFDDQNGIFFQYDGTNFSVGLRSSTFQLTGTISVDSDSNSVTGSNTRFADQLKVGDRIVIRGMTHVVTKVSSQTSISINPDYRGVSNAVNTKASLTKEQIIPQHMWNLDRGDGTGQSGYNIQINKMQMIGFQFSWYGAGFIDWMLRGPDGNYVFIHRMKNNNKNTEAFMRSGNLPVRYEVINDSPKIILSESITETSSSLFVEDSSLLPDSGTLYVDNELISYSGKTLNQLTGLNRSATFTNFADGSIRSYLAGAAAAHTKNTGAVLATVTATPQINHWGSAYLTDGKFDEDRGYIFSYRLPRTPLTQIRTTLFMIRLSPSVSNAILGDLGERELINRAQLLLKNIDVVVEDGTNSETVIVEGILNPSNYPFNPDDVSWQVLNNQGAGGQPSFAQIATDVDWGTTTGVITAQNTRDIGRRSSQYFLKSEIAGVNIGDSVSSVGADSNSDFNGSQTVTNIRDATWIDSVTAYVDFSSSINTGNALQTTFSFTSLAGATAVPGEQVFAFTAGATGSRDGIDLSGLKELTNTPIGGRGTFPNGPDVLAINAYLTGGSGNVTINLRWSEAQA